MDRQIFYVKSYKHCCLCPGGDASSGLETGCSEYGLFHSTGVAKRNGLTAVCHIPSPFCHFACCFHDRCVVSASGIAEQRLDLRLFPVVARCDSTERLRNSLDYLRSVLNDSTSFKLIYRYAFDFARVSQAKSLQSKDAHMQRNSSNNLFAK